MKKNLLLFLVGILFMGGCKHRTSLSPMAFDGIMLEPLNQTVYIDSNISRFIESVEPVDLQGNGTPFTSYVKKLLVTAGKDIIVLTDTGIHKFDKKGNYLFPFGRMGRGPGEYLIIYDICLNNMQTELWGVNDQNEVFKYDLLDGGFIGKVQTRENSNLPNASAICPSNNDGFFLYAGNPFPPGSMDDFYCLVKFNKEGVPVEQMVKHTDFNINFSFIPSVTQVSGNRYLLRPQENENVCYCIENGNVTGLYHIHFGKKNIKPLFSYENTADPWERLEDFINDDSYKIPMTFGQTATKLFFMAWGPQSRLEYFLYDNSSWKGIHWTNKGNNQVQPFLILASDEEYLYAVINEYQIFTDKDFENMDPLFAYIIKEGNIRLEENDNPKVVKIKFTGL